MQLSEGSEQFKAIEAEWREKAKQCTLETLPGFLTELAERYRHDYGTICHAIGMAAVAAASAMNHSSQGGITGFQASAVMWRFVREWSHSNNVCGLRLINYDNFLYPQYEHDFQKVLSRDVWKRIQEAARAELDKADNEYLCYLKAHEQYKIDIAAFIEKYPDYDERREYYSERVMGTAEEWKLEEKKKASGFEFAPTEPQCYIGSSSPIYQHWRSICEGEVPFGYVIEDD